MTGRTRSPGFRDNQCHRREWERSGPREVLRRVASGTGVPYLPPARKPRAGRRRSRAHVDGAVDPTEGKRPAVTARLFSHPSRARIMIAAAIAAAADRSPGTGLIRNGGGNDVVEEGGRDDGSRPAQWTSAG